LNLRASGPDGTFKTYKTLGTRIGRSAVANMQLPAGTLVSAFRVARLGWSGGCREAVTKVERNVAMVENRNALTMNSEFFEEHPTSFHLDCFTVLNEGFRQWEPLPPAALAKAFLVITAEDVSDGKFATRNIGISQTR